MPSIFMTKYTIIASRPDKVCFFAFIAIILYNTRSLKKRRNTMNHNEKSRQIRKKKNRKASIIAGLIILLILVFAFAFAKSKLSSDPGKKPGVTDSKSKEPKDKDQKAADKDETEKTENREEIEKIRKEELKEFYVPLPEEKKKIEERVTKGLYLNHNNVHLGFDEGNIDAYGEYVKYVLGQAESYPTGAENANVVEKMLALCNTTEANAIVVDIKTDDGYLTWQSDIDIVKDLDTDADSDHFDYERLIKYMKDHDIRPIARIVCFKDTFLANASPDHAMEGKGGEPFIDNSGASWVDQTDEFVWKYLVAIGQETALRGFEEIHFDYIRYPEATSEFNQKDSEGNPIKRDENIASFLEFAREGLDPYGVRVASAVFGIITSTWEDEPEDIGQTWIKITPHVDTISPMIYPSHYSTGWYGYDVPDYEPYGVFHQAMAEAYEKNSAVEGAGKIRPWIQGFTADYMNDFAEYDGKMIADQVLAANEYGIEGFLIWNALNEYDPEIFKYTSQAKKHETIKIEELPEYTYLDILAEEADEARPVEDILGRSPYDLAKMFFDSITNDNSGRTFLVTKRSEREKTYDEFESNPINNLDFDYYEIIDAEKKDDHYLVTVRLYQGEETKDIGVKIGLEDEMFKVINPKDLLEANRQEASA